MNDVLRFTTGQVLSLICISIGATLLVELGVVKRSAWLAGAAVGLVVAIIVAVLLHDPIAGGG